MNNIKIEAVPSELTYRKMLDDIRSAGVVPFSSNLATLRGVVDPFNGLDKITLAHTDKRIQPKANYTVAQPEGFTPNSSNKPVIDDVEIIEKMIDFYTSDEVPSNSIYATAYALLHTGTAQDVLKKYKGKITADNISSFYNELNASIDEKKYAETLDDRSLKCRYYNSTSEYVAYSHDSNGYFFEGVSPAHWNNPSSRVLPGQSSGADGFNPDMRCYFFSNGDQVTLTRLFTLISLQLQIPMLFKCESSQGDENFIIYFSSSDMEKVANAMLWARTQYPDLVLNSKSPEYYGGNLMTKTTDGKDFVLDMINLCHNGHQLYYDIDKLNAKGFSLSYQPSENNTYITNRRETTPRQEIDACWNSAAIIELVFSVLKDKDDSKKDLQTQILDLLNCSDKSPDEVKQYLVNLMKTEFDASLQHHKPKLSNVTLPDKLEERLLNLLRAQLGATKEESDQIISEILEKRKPQIARQTKNFAEQIGISPSSHALSTSNEANILNTSNSYIRKGTIVSTEVNLEKGTCTIAQSVKSGRFEAKQSDFPIVYADYDGAYILKEDELIMVPFYQVSHEHRLEIANYYAPKREATENFDSSSAIDVDFCKIVPNIDYDLLRYSHNGMIITVKIISVTSEGFVCGVDPKKPTRFIRFPKNFDKSEIASLLPGVKKLYVNKEKSIVGVEKTKDGKVYLQISSSQSNQCYRQELTKKNKIYPSGIAYEDCIIPFDSDDASKFYGDLLDMSKTSPLTFGGTNLPKPTTTTKTN